MRMKAEARQPLRIYEFAPWQDLSKRRGALWAAALIAPIEKCRAQAAKAR